MKKITLKLIVISMLFLNGCTLANEEVRNETSFVGYLVSSKRFETLPKEEVIEGKYYAQVNDKTNRYEFDETEDTFYFVLFHELEDNESYIDSSAGEAILEKQMNYSVDDKESLITLKGKIYVLPSMKQNPFYIHPVYQDSDGRIYAIEGELISLANLQVNVGVLTQERKETAMFKMEDSSQKSIVEVKLDFQLMDRPQSIDIIQMSKENLVLVREKFEADNVPTRLNVKEETNYIVVETMKIDEQNKTYIEREIIDTKAENLVTYSVIENGFIKEKFSELIWVES